MTNKPSLKIIDFHRPNDAIIKVLEELLELAKNGELQSIAMVGLSPNATWTEVCSELKPDQVLPMIGAIESLKMNVMFNNVEF